MNAMNAFAPPCQTGPLIDTVVAVASLLATFVSACIAGVSAVYAWKSVRLAKKALRQARAEAARNLQDWRQRKWFDLYFQADEVYDLLDKFIAAHVNQGVLQGNQSNWGVDWNDFNLQARRVNRITVTFPQCAAIDALHKATAFPNLQTVNWQQRLNAIFDATEEIRKYALVEAAVLMPIGKQVNP